jgi:hypothetical protein
LRFISKNGAPYSQVSQRVIDVFPPTEHRIASLTDKRKFLPGTNKQFRVSAIFVFVFEAGIVPVIEFTGYGVAILYYVPILSQPNGLRTWDK